MHRYAFLCFNTSSKDLFKDTQLRERDRKKERGKRNSPALGTVQTHDLLISRNVLFRCATTAVRVLFLLLLNIILLLPAESFLRLFPVGKCPESPAANEVLLGIRRRWKNVVADETGNGDASSVSLSTFVKRRKSKQSTTTQACPGRGWWKPNSCKSCGPSYKTKLHHHHQ